MGSHRTGSDEAVVVETGLLSVTIRGPHVHPAFPAGEITEKESVFRVTCTDEYYLNIPKDWETTYTQVIGGNHTGEYQCIPLFFEQQRYEIAIQAKEEHTVSFWHENPQVRRAVSPPFRNQDNLLTGILNFGNDIGLSDLYILVDGKQYMKLTLEVFPSKISYKEDYQAIVADVTREVYNLVFDFLKKTYNTFDIADKQQASPVEFFAIIRKIYKEFTTAADMILSNPHHELRTEHEILPAHKIKRTDNRTLRWLEKHPEETLRKDGRILVNKAPAVRKYITYDTNENRVTKYMLETTAKRLEHFKNQYAQLDRETDLTVTRDIDSMVRGILRRSNTGFLREVQSEAAGTGMSLVLGMAPGYRELYRCYLLLQHGLSVTGGIFRLSVKDIAVLYEYWCFIKLNSLMRQKYSLISQDILKVEGKNLSVSLVKGTRSRVRYRNAQNGEIITLSYNPSEINVPTVSQRPDNVLRLEKDSPQEAYEYVFDAKYKIDPALPGSLYAKYYQTPGPTETDINTMHRYRDAIVAQKGTDPYRHTMFGAYVLFPYHNEEEYAKHKFYRSIDEVNIGGLPFLPTATSLTEKLLDDLITDTSEAAFERTVLPIGIEKRLAETDWTRRDVLVGSVRTVDQLTYSNNTKEYYIPASRITEDKKPIHFIALYQPRYAFGSEAGIRYYGEVVSSQIVNWENVPEEFWSSEEEYYCFKVRTWKTLSRPVEAKEQGFTQLFTNIFLLEHSSQVPELMIQNEAEYRFWYELKRRTDATFINDKEDIAGFRMNDMLITFESGEIHLVRDGELLDHCKISEFVRKPNNSFRRMMKYITVLNDE